MSGTFSHGTFSHAGCSTGASQRPGGAWQSVHRGGGVDPPRAGAARAAYHTAGAVGPVGKHACLHARGSAAAPLSWISRCHHRRGRVRVT